MSAADHSGLVEGAIALVSRAHTKALAQAKAQPESTWIDAVCAIGAAEAQLLVTQPGAAPQVASEGEGRHTCIGLLEDAERSLAQIPAGQGPVSLALIRAHLTEAIVETAGREP